MQPEFDTHRIGLFGGTFDPVHFGHLRAAIEMAEAYQLSTLYLLPNHRPAHRGPTGASTQQRIEMLQMAVASAPRLKLDTREANRDAPSYTVDTLNEVRQENPEASLIFFLGLDAFAKFEHWHRWQDILQLANLVVVDRPGASHSEFSASLLKDRAGEYGAVSQNDYGAIEMFDITALDISATAIRNSVAESKNIRFLLPDMVRQFIETRGLYRIHSDD